MKVQNIQRYHNDQFYKFNNIWFIRINVKKIEVRLTNKMHERFTIAIVKFFVFDKNYSKKTIP